MDWLLVQRADADDDDRDRAEQLAARLGSTLTRTEDPAELDAVIDGVDSGGLVVCGGDGSLHHAANALVRVGALDRIVVALLPAGTGNDYAGFLALPTEPDEIADLLSSASPGAVDLIRLRSGETDLGVAVNAVHTGIGVEAADRAQDLKDALGDLAYPVGSLQAGFTGKGWEVEVLADGARLDHAEPVLMAAVTSGGTIGGGRPISPRARVDDGQVDVMVSHAVTAAARAAFAVGLARGTHVDRDDVVYRTAREVRLRGGRLRLNVDGELWEDPVEDPSFEVMPGALQFVSGPR